MSVKKKILVLRFSALGDVAMTVPVIWSLKQQYPDCEIVFVSQAFVRPLFEPIEGVTFVSANYKKEHKGLWGLFKLYKKIKAYGSFHFVADIHGVLRTYILDFLFQLSGTKVIKIDKGRVEKAKLCKNTNKKLVQLPHSINRYKEVFEKGGFSLQLNSFSTSNLYKAEFEDAKKLIFLDKNKKRIGIAPFAKHQWKIWPEHLMQELLKKLSDTGYQIFLFGGKGNEQSRIEKMIRNLPNAKNLAGFLNMKQELEVMSNLDLMLCMDSVNMHLASLVNLPVVSIWGATHPYAGFYGWNQNPANAIQIDLECRPCSIFGNKECYRKDFKCMNDISPNMVYDKIAKII
jgi:ADP-heptose:LPS heptosyltransferase